MFQFRKRRGVMWPIGLGADGLNLDIAHQLTHVPLPNAHHLNLMKAEAVPRVAPMRTASRVYLGVIFNLRHKTSLERDQNVGRAGHPPDLNGRAELWRCPHVIMTVGQYACPV